ncbi:MAG: cytochrome c3 family protein [Phycisphaerae bacterium]
MMRSKMIHASVALSLLFTGEWALGGVEGSKHDFSNRAWSGGNRCGACHSPHHSKPPAAAPLWDAKADLSQRFGTSAGRPKRPGPGRGTMICVRCHDGTIAKEALGGVKRKRFVNTQHPGVFSASQSPTDHPVGIDYPRFDKGFNPLTTVVAKGPVLLPNAKVECVSCHDPHNTTGVKYMLVKSNTRSALCLTCHKK